MAALLRIARGFGSFSASVTDFPSGSIVEAF
jgi:hypothetical protein